MSRTEKDKPYWVKLNDYNRYDFKYRCFHHTHAGKAINHIISFDIHYVEAYTYSFVKADGTEVFSETYHHLRDLSLADTLETGVPHTIRTKKRIDTINNSEYKFIGYNPLECDRDKILTSARDGDTQMCSRFLKGYKKTIFWYDRPDHSIIRQLERKRRTKKRADMNRYKNLHNSGVDLADMDLTSTETMVSPHTEWSIY